MADMSPSMQDSDVPDAAAMAARMGEVRDAAERLRRQIGTAIVGQHDVIEQLLICLFCRGHAVLVGVPGLAKTLLISTIARALDLSFSRIQFTPDLMPSDITGTQVIEEDRSTGRRELRFVRGPIFGHVILADEINRTPPKTQAALLEAMQERRVTAGGEHHDLPQPFFVLATQNPIEQEGTYPLPEAQLDRFLLMIQVDYPSAEEELQIVRRTTAGHEAGIEAVLDAADVLRIAELVRAVPIADHVASYAIRLARATRHPDRGENSRGEKGEQGDLRPEFIRRYVAWGAGPRASQGLVLAGKARAILDGRTHVTPDDIRAVAHPILRHRLIPNFAAEADGIRVDDLIDRLLAAIPLNAEDPVTARRMDAVLRGGRGACGSG